jgi:hypothetical protein|tara:strand:+ start:258 stop:677 length:420 start_codon:yes stop_codon:yes gene_type:complete
MIEKFNGIFYLAIFAVHFGIYAFYAYRCLFDTRAFMAQYGMDDSAAIMTRFFGSMFSGSFLMAGYITFVRPNGLEASWAFFNLVFIQNFCAFIFAMWSHQKNHLGVNEKTSLVEGIIIPGILTLLSAILCYGLSGKIYI